jgi:uncharacterized protein (DUF2236 family)
MHADAAASIRIGPPLARLRHRVAAGAASLSRRMHAVRPEHLLWVALAMLFVLFVLVLLFEPTAAGRGGR